MRFRKRSRSNTSRSLSSKVDGSSDQPTNVEIYQTVDEADDECTDGNLNVNVRKKAKHPTTRPRKTKIGNLKIKVISPGKPHFASSPETPSHTSPRLAAQRDRQKAARALKSSLRTRIAELKAAFEERIASIVENDNCDPILHSPEIQAIPELLTPYGFLLARDEIPSRYGGKTEIEGALNHRTCNGLLCKRITLQDVAKPGSPREIGHWEVKSWNVGGGSWTFQVRADSAGSSA